LNIRRSIILRVRIAFLITTTFALAAVSKIVILQNDEGGKWARISEEVDFEYKTVKATRGNIYSDNGSLLATSVPSYIVAMDPTIVESSLYKSGIDSLAWMLSRQYNDQSKEYYKRKINEARLSGKKYIILNRKQIDYPDKKAMKTWPIFREGRNKGGVIFEKVDRRYRPFSYLGHRTIGFMNTNNDGAGIEYSYDNYLAGKDGKALYQKIAGGSWMPLFDGSEVKPVEGYDVHTTINVNIQDVAESALNHAMNDHDADYGCVVVMEVESGEIKAMSNLTRNTKNGGYRDIFNYAVQGLGDPGSTFKTASIIALLEDSRINLADSINTGNGTIKYYNQTMRDHIEGGHGTIPISHAFEVSSNVAISKLVNSHFGSKPEEFIDYINSFGLSRPLGFQMEGEATPKIKHPSDKSWSGITLPWMSIGYEIELTPLQILAFYNGIANDGKVIRPIIVKSINQADDIIEEFETEVLVRSICSGSTLKKIRKLLVGVVENGTAANIKDSHYKIAGKTGTAQKIVDGKYTKQYNTSFVGYFPADEPKYSCIVVINSPRGFRQFGSNVTAPVFKEIADKIYSLDILEHPVFVTKGNDDMEVFPVIRAGQREELEMICDEFDIPNKSTTDADWVKARVKDNAVLWTTDEIAPEVVPNVLGMTLRDAIFLLENQGLYVSHAGSGRIVSQSLAPGRRIQKGLTISLRLG
jgi:cell division protein FtsI (penicillin-binding protein 3)